MGMFDWMFGDENVRKALSDRAYLDPSAITDPVQKAAALEAGKRMEISQGLGGAAQAISQANMKGGGIGDLLAAGAGGFATGGDDMLKRQYMAAQTRGSMAQARKHEAEARYYGGGGSGMPTVVRDADGRVHRLTPKGYKPVPKFEQEGYAKVDLPPMPSALNPDQTVVAGSSPNGFPYPKGMTYTDTQSGQRYVSDGTQWIKQG